MVHEGGQGARKSTVRDRGLKSKRAGNSSCDWLLSVQIYASG